MKVLITGGSGFVGNHIARTLSDKKKSLYAFDRGADEKSERLFKKIFFGDLVNKNDIEKVLLDLKPDVVFHLAAQANSALSFKRPSLTLKTNLIGSLNIFESIRKIKNKNKSYNPKVLIAGSADAYGKVNAKDLPVTEKSEYDPTSPYAVSKLSLFYLMRVYVKAYGIRMVYVEPFNHTGPGQDEGFFVPDMCVQIAQIEKGYKDPIIETGNLDAARDLSDVRDIVSGYRLLLEKGVSGEKYILCSGKYVKMSWILQKLLSFSSINIKHVYDKDRFRPVDNKILYGDFSKAKSQIGWEPKISIAKTLKDTLEWYQKKMDN